MADKRRLLTDSEIDFLAESYLKLKADKTYKNLSKTFQDYLNEFLDEELIALKKMRGEICKIAKTT